MMKKLLATMCLAWATCAHAVPSVWVFNETTNAQVETRNIHQVRPIASLTKLMTAMVALDHDSDLHRKICMPAGRLPAGLYTRKDIITAMLVRSDNQASDIIAADYPGGRRAFVQAMNKKARDIGMQRTQFVDPSGLSRNNRSNASDVMTMMQVSAGYNIIRTTSVMKQAIFETHYRKKIRTIELPNTNQPLLFKFDEIVVSKTGFTAASGWSVGLVVEAQAQRFIVVILGAKSKQERFDLARNVVYNHLRDIDIDAMSRPVPPPSKSIWDFFGL